MPDLRKDPITGRWVIISTDRARRPSDFSRESFKIKGGFCPFCPGNESKTPPEILGYRPTTAGGPSAPKDSPGWRVRVVPNKFPALMIEGNLDRQADGMFDRMIDLKQDKRFKYILAFKNHGDAAGSSMEHPHSQLIALPILPKNVAEELEGAKQYYNYKERCIFCDVIQQELETKTRVIAENSDFVTLAPYAPRFPFETWILPRRHESAFENASSQMYENLARTLQTLIAKADRVLDHPAYNFMIHTSPIGDSTNDYYHWHIEFLPKLTKVAGFEWGSGFYINPTPPEEAAQYLRECKVEAPIAEPVGA